MDNVNWQSKYRDEIQKALDSAPKDWHKRERDVVGTWENPKDIPLDYREEAECKDCGG